MTRSKKKQRGRPLGYRAENPADKTLPKVRVTDDQLSSYREASEQQDMTLSSWIRGVLDKAVKRVLK